MIVILMLIVVACLSVWLVTKWRRVKRYWLERGVPHYPPHPVLGSLTFLQRENPSRWMRKLYKDFAAPYVGIWLFWRPALVINSPDIAKRVLVKDADVFRNRFLSSGKTDPIGALNIFTVNDPLWSSLRRRLTSVFTAAKLRSLNGITVSKAKNLVNRIDIEIQKSEPMDLRKIFTDYTTDVIGESAFGVTSNSLVDGDSIMRNVTREFGSFDLHRGLSWSSIFFFPELVDIFRFSFFPKDTIEVLRKIFRSVIDQRGGYEKEVKDARDLLDALLKIKQEAAKEDEEISEDLLLAQAAIFLLGGFETSGGALSWTIYELAWNPQCQEKLYQEVLETKRKIGGRNFDSAIVSEIPYLDCVIKETLRIYPPMGWLDRISSKDYKIDDNLTIPAGTTIYVNGVSMQMDPQYFPEPEVYNPDRFLPDNERDITPYSYMPFGEGPRSCIGTRFAYQTLRLGLAEIILKYEVRVLPNTPKPTECQVEKNGLLLMPSEKLSVEFVKRDNEFVS
uniref:unspecific monooxygenase n=1 Tax=Helicoverpa armigera TaxID=29058 RepID=A0A068EU25_HELAM|nr:cytochrome P450 CYP324A1 [Helicoverpa armigera]